MAKTGIDYGEQAWNPIAGCREVSEGCANCWARKMAFRMRAMGRPEYQGVVDDRCKWTGEVQLMTERLEEPLRWKKPRTILVAFMGDLFHTDISHRFIWDVFDVMAKTPQHRYFVLTKRPVGMQIVTSGWQAGRKPPENIWLGVTVENQWRADDRRYWMRKLSDAGWKTWVSYGPALGMVDWTGWEFLDWMAAEGESGVHARLTHPDWLRRARDFCVGQGIPFYFKSWGEWAPLDHLAWATDATLFTHRPVEFEGVTMCQVGKGMAGYCLDGRVWRGTP